MPEKLELQLQMSSIVISTNPFGDFSKVTIISDLLSDDDMKEMTRKAKKLWQKFVHQPQTGRCLVFFLILEKLCRIITEDFLKAMHHLAPIMDLGDIYTRVEGLQTNSEQAIKELALQEWTLELLYRMHVSLQASVDSVLGAKKELMAQVLDGPGTRSIALEATCQEYTGRVEDTITHMAVVSSKLEASIALQTRFEEAFSSAMAMADSRTSLNQNATVKQLTYLTMAYLPIGLIVAIFAIPSEQLVIKVPMGTTWLVISIIIALACTYLAAFYVGKIVRYVKSWWGKVGRS
ncbi:hypothetical protein B0H67DRAFT_392546 [Lasiosphaeris hirsuta]|uniref:Uncharacterized protein n=1 Tax=Lasiosphaeris hirsuta TaxID=260670 RepID=A0AA39ZSF4_9PEZI|nr:hypothetical protein B0H67DRAFT_392546 [Lasiosphaeris hirsuta]